MSNSIGGGEVMRLSFGCDANAVSSHLCNLEGLACTTSSNCNSSCTSARTLPLCDPYITHYCSPSNQLFTPRCIFVDTDDQQLMTPTTAMTTKTSNNASKKTKPVSGEDAVITTWSGKVEKILLPSKAGNNDNNPFELFHQIAQSVADHQYSFQECSGYSSHAKYTITSNNSNSRHVEWDDDGEEEDSDDTHNDTDTNNNTRVLQEKKRLHEQHLLLQEAMNNAWEDGVLDLRKNNNHSNAIQWRDYLLPPLPPHKKMISLPLSLGDYPYNAEHTVSDIATLATTAASQSNNNNNNMADSHVVGYDATNNNTTRLSRSWREDVLSNEIRKSLEQCDLLRGTQLLVSDVGLYAGLATSVLEELIDECKSAARLTILVSSSLDQNTTDNQCNRRQVFRRHLNGGLAFHHLSESSDLMLPLSLSSSSLFSSSASLATAIETATVPYRLTPNNSATTIAIAGGTGLGSYNYQDDSFFSTYSYINFREFLSCLRGPTTRHTILGMDVSDNKKSLDWNEALLEGTSVLFDPRIKQQQRVLPASHVAASAGSWLSNNLCSLSRTSGTSSRTHVDDQQHTQYAMHASFRTTSHVRPTSYQKQKFKHPLLLHGIMEGIATHARPIGSFSSCLIPQSLTELTSAGGYWNSIISKDADFFVSTIQNSTHIHSLIEDRYKNMKSAISRFNSSSSSMRGYYTADVEAGLAPELEDCDETLEYLKNLDAVYCPSSSF